MLDDDTDVIEIQMNIAIISINLKKKFIFKYHLKRDTPEKVANEVLSQFNIPSKYLNSIRNFISEKVNNSSSENEKNQLRNSGTSLTESSNNNKTMTRKLSVTDLRISWDSSTEEGKLNNNKRLDKSTDSLSPSKQVNRSIDIINEMKDRTIKNNEKLSQYQPSELLNELKEKTDKNQTEEKKKPK